MPDGLVRAYGYANGQNSAQSFQTMVAEVSFPPEVRRVKRKRPTRDSETVDRSTRSRSC